MAIHYEVPEGQSLLIEGPANVIVKTGGVPRVDVPPEPPEPEAEEASATRKKSK